MSSILDALKKAQQESGETRDNQKPWPAPLPMDMAHRKNRSHPRWLFTLVFVLIAAVGAGFALYWPAEKTSPPPPTIALKTTSAEPSVDTPTSRPQPQPQPQPPEPALPASTGAAARPPSPPRAVPTSAKPPKPSISGPNVPSQPKLTQPEPPRRKSSLAASPSGPVQTKPAMSASAAPTKPALPPKADIAADETGPPAKRPPAVSTPKPISIDSSPVDTQPSVAVKETEKSYREDPRVELQALVWAPESAQRFVVINNHLVREGGSVDGIAILKIDPDDVLLSEGGNRWYQKFNIR